jgi:hypothetical protein
MSEAARLSIDAAPRDVDAVWCLPLRSGSRVVTCSGTDSLLNDPEPY